jgi:DNA-binding CsgD family transcriptional regulator
MATARSACIKATPSFLLQLACASLIANEALPNHEIARRLCISEQLVKNYVHQLFVLCGVQNRVQLALYFRRYARCELFELGLRCLMDMSEASAQESRDGSPARRSASECGLLEAALPANCA